MTVMLQRDYKAGDDALYKTWIGSGKDYREVEVPVTIVRLGTSRVFIQHKDGSEHWCERRKLRPVERDDKPMGLNIGNIDLKTDAFIGQCVAVLGIRGSGKTTTAAVLIEELMPDMPFVIFDPEGEYYGLKEKYPVLIAGSGANVELPVTARQAGALAEYALDHQMSVILDTSDFDADEAADFMLEYLSRLWELAGQRRAPCCIVLEEAHEFIPQAGKPSPLAALLTRIALRGRKRGLVLMIVNQRSSNIAKNVLTQAGMFFLHRVAHAADMTVYKDLIPGLSGKEVEAMVRGLQSGQAVFVRGEQAQVVQMRQRHTSHGGPTPGLAAAPLPVMDSDTLESLKKFLQADTPHPADDEAAKLRAIIQRQAEQIAMLETQLKASVQEITRQREQKVEFAPSTPLQAWQPKPSKSTPASPLSPPLRRGEANREGVPGVNGKAVTVQSPAPLTEVLAERQKKLDERIISQQRKKLGEICSQISQQSYMQRLMLAYLIDHDADVIPAGKLSGIIGYPEDRINKLPPTGLLDLNLICRDTGKALNMGYWLNDEIQAGYPNLEVKEIMAALRRACEVWG